MDITSGCKRERENDDLNNDVKKIKLEDGHKSDDEQKIALSEVPSMSDSYNEEDIDHAILTESKAYADFKKGIPDILTAGRRYVMPSVSALKRKLPIDGEIKLRIQRFLYWLENEARLTNAKRYDDSIWALNLITDTKSDYQFPNYYQRRAQQLKDKFAMEQQAARLVKPPERSAGRPRLKKLSSEEITATDKSIPRWDHPIFSEGGIMYGIKMCQGNVQKTKKLRTDLQQRGHKVFGHNAIAVGTWFPSQLCTIMYGAHGRSQGGISGSPSEGAYSVILSGSYEGIDEDRGDIVRYAGTNSQTQAERTDATKTMFRSVETGRPIRLMRAASRSNNPSSSYAPIVGIRYDGLYRAVGIEKVSKQGREHDLFKLVREPDQPNLRQLGDQRPTAQEKSDYGRINDAY